MTGFQSPNYTQTPNDLFDELLPEMGLAELKVVMSVIRRTFGYHRDEVRISIRELARATGLSAKSVMAGAELAESHGLLERYQDGNKTTLWRAIVSVVPTTTRRDTKYHAGVIPTTTQVRSKESKETKKNSANAPALSIENAIAVGQPVSEQVQSEEQTRREALTDFERVFGFGELPWSKDATWTKFEKFVFRLARQSPGWAADYVQWRETDGKYKAFSNRKIRENPTAFMDTGYPEYDAAKMYRKPAPTFSDTLQRLEQEVAGAIPNPFTKPASLRKA